LTPAHVVPVEAGNAAAKAGTLGSTVEKILADLKPEAAYFFADDNGNRAPTATCHNAPEQSGVMTDATPTIKDDWSSEETDDPLYRHARRRIVVRRQQP
jgi:hypothetical protein